MSGYLTVNFLSRVKSDCKRRWSIDFLWVIYPTLITLLIASFFFFFFEENVESSPGQYF